MNLIDLIDMEAQLHRDAGGDPETVRARDRAIALGLAPLPEDRATLFRQWLAALRDADTPLPGRRIALAFRWVRLILVFGGLLLGWGAAKAVLAYDGSTPINALHFLAILVGGQMVLLILLVLALLPKGWTRWLPLVGDLQSLTATALQAMVRGWDWLLGRISAGHRARIAADLGYLKSRQGLYAPIERWSLLSITQILGICFNLGALGCLLYLVTVKDLAFSWSTTLDLDAGSVHSMIQLIATPWSWCLPEAVPSLDMVEQTAFSRFHNNYIGAGALRQADPQVIGAWWRFLSVALVSYGLLPRVLAWLGARIYAGWLLRRVRLDTGVFDALHDRLLRPLVSTGSRARASGGVHLVLWRNLPLAADAAAGWVEASMGQALLDLHHAGGAEIAQTEQTLHALADAHMPGARVVLLLDGALAPTRAETRFLQDVRGAIGPARAIIVGVMKQDGAGIRAADAEHLAHWRKAVAAIADPDIRVDTWERVDE